MKSCWAAGLGSVVALWIVCSASAATNEWTKASSGNWEEPYWSLGLPSTSQEAVAINNPGWKAVAIGPNTIANYPSSLQINNLLIDAPVDSRNQLLLNWAGLSVPLVVRSNLNIGTNGSLASHHSTMLASTVQLDGSAEYSDSSTATLEQITLGSQGVLQINDVYLISSYLVFRSGVVTQSQGIAVITNITTQLSGNFAGFTNLYLLGNGRLVSDAVSLGMYDLSGFERCAFLQSGGVHTNNSMSVWGGGRHFQQVIRVGKYELTGGLLVSGQTTVYGGMMEQSGGTNLTRQLTIGAGGYYRLSGGQLVTSNTVVGTMDCLRDAFAQSGGNHIIQNTFILQPTVRYTLTGGTLSAPVIDIGTGAELAAAGGVVSNPGMVVLRRGVIGLGTSPQTFGKLQVLDAPGYSCGQNSDAPAIISMGSSVGHGEVRFADSRDMAWDGSLQILNWSTNHAGNGPDRIFVGTSAQALTSEQVSRIIFIRPSGLSSDYSARLTASGELVPAMVRDYNYETTNGTVTLLDYTGPGGNITVPSLIDNLPVTSLGNGVFATTLNLTSVTLPNTITNIGDKAFRYCTALTTINLGNGVIRIGNNAFEDCDSLTSITIPASVRELGYRMFDSCDTLVAIAVHPDNLFYSSLDGVLFDKTQTRLIQYPPHKAGTYVVPETVASIEDSAFRACYQLTSVALGASVTNIALSAFEFCTGMTNITIREGVKSIGDFAFWDCASLPSITLPDTLVLLGSRVFEQCGALTRAEMGRGLAYFGGAHFFAYCPNLAGVYFRGDAPVVVSDFQPSTPNVTVYYLPGTIGWGATYAARPTAPWYLPKPVVLDFGPGFGVKTNRFGFVISWATNATVVVEASTSLTNPNWTVISSHTLSGGTSYFSDPQWTNYVRRFYRLRKQ